MNLDKALEIIQAVSQRRGLEDKVAEARVRRSIHRMVEDLLPEQQAVWRDIESGEDRIALLCGRRAGKTHLCAVLLVISALLHPETWSCYTSITKQMAKNQLWQRVKNLNRQYGLGGKPHGTDLTLTFPNGAIVGLFGLDKMDEAEKQRGYPMALNILDEAASHAPRILDYFLKEVVGPALADVAGAQILSGTPANHCMGAFFEASTGIKKGWATHTWTLLQNSRLNNGDPQGWLDRKMEEEEWDETNPIYQREYMARWVRSTESVVYGYRPEINDDYDIHQGPEWHQVLGIDLGADKHEPKTAFTVWRFKERDENRVYAVRSFKTMKKTATEMAREIRELQQAYGDFTRVVMDTGALGNLIADEITKRHDIPIHPAEKSKKYDMVEAMDDDLRHGRIRVHPQDCKDLVEEWQMLQWDQKEGGRRIEDARFPNHCADSALYGWRECLHWIKDSRKKRPKRGSEEHWSEEEKRMLEVAKKRFTPKTEDPWGVEDVDLF